MNPKIKAALDKYKAAVEATGDPVGTIRDLERYGLRMQLTALVGNSLAVAAKKCPRCELKTYDVVYTDPRLLCETCTRELGTP